MKPKTRNALFEIFGSYIIPMCKGTALEDKPYLGVKWRNEVCFALPTFTDGLEVYEFALGILDDEFLFKDDVVYRISDGEKFKLKSRSEQAKDRPLLHLYQKEGHLDTHTMKPCILSRDFTTTKPEPPRTFMLNGTELPCPLKRKDSLKTEVHEIEIADNYFYFINYEEANKVEMTLFKILREARGETDTEETN